MGHGTYGIFREKGETQIFQCVLEDCYFGDDVGRPHKFPFEDQGAGRIVPWSILQKEAYCP